MTWCIDIFHILNIFCKIELSSSEFSTCDDRTSRSLLQHKTTRLSICPYTREKNFSCSNCYRRQTSESEIRCRCLRSKTRRELRKKEIELARAGRATLVLEPGDSGEIHEDRFRNNGAVNFVAIEAWNGKDRKYNHHGRQLAWKTF